MKANDAITIVISLSAKTQDRLHRAGIINAAMYALARHYRWRRVCSGGGRGGFAAWRLKHQQLTKSVHGK